jgi:Uma2 family endonuclease
VTEAIAVLSFEEFCAAEGRGDRRHELVGGRVYAMAGGSERHDLAAGLLYEAIARNARTAGCRAFLANRLVRTMAGNGYYPDVMVVCGPAAHRLYEQNPTLVVEVLSRSTEDVDRREKAQAYSTSTSLRQYILVDPDHRRIEVATPTGDVLAWAVIGPGDVLDTGYGIVDIDAFYDELDLTATT